MNAQELDEKLANIPPAIDVVESATARRSQVDPASERPPLEVLIAGALVLATRMPPGDGGQAQRDKLQTAARVRARLPDIFTDCTPQELIGPARVKDSRLVAAARSVRWRGPGFILLGHTGIGKSSAAAWMFRKLLGDGVRGGDDLWYAASRLRWFKAAALMRARAEHPLGRGDAPEMIEAMTASVLFVDDAGWDRDDPSAVSHVLAERYDNGLPTVLTSGLTVEQLTEHYGDAPVRRLGKPGSKESVLVDCFEKPCH